MTDPLRDTLDKAMQTAALGGPPDKEGIRHWRTPGVDADDILAALPPDALQAWRDGLAMNALRKAAGPGAYWCVRGLESGVEADIVAGAGDVAVGHHGRTIAEAADKAREDLR